MKSPHLHLTWELSPVHFERVLSAGSVLPLPAVTLWPRCASLDPTELQDYQFLLHLAPKHKAYLGASLETVVCSLLGGK